ncbi:MAG: tnpA [Chlorobi bacterium]|nr:tnpA [Chlorobiota bacterium]
MPHSLAKVLLHIVFSTKYRQPMIHPSIEDELYRYMSAICRYHGSPAIRIGGIADHVHIACSLGRSVAICDLVEEVKRNSSKWMKSKGSPEFRWQNGYGVFSFRESEVPIMTRYIERQKIHHRELTFKEEYRKFLIEYCIPFDEKYIWD